jgi:HAD superfamily hydrolase (TIGR01490 family)
MSEANKGAAFFDLDKTILAKSSALAFGMPFSRAGLLSRRSMLRSAYSQLMFSLQGADHDKTEKLRQYLSKMVTGWPVDDVNRIVAETLNDLIVPMIFDEAATLIEDHKAAGREVVIVSTSGADIVEPIAQMLGADKALATRLAVSEGRYTGEIWFYCHGDNKAVAMREYALEQGYDLNDCFAYSDSITDVPMLEAVGHPFVVNPDKGLRRIAAERSWPVLEFKRPVAITSRFRSISVSPTPAIATAAGVSVLGLLVLYIARRRRRRLISASE